MRDRPAPGACALVGVLIRLVFDDECADVGDSERVRSTPQAGVSYTLVPARLFSLSYVTTGYTYLPRVKVQE